MRNVAVHLSDPESYEFKANALFLCLPPFQTFIVSPQLGLNLIWTSGVSLHINGLVNFGLM